MSYKPSKRALKLLEKCLEEIWFKNPKLASELDEFLEKYQEKK